MDFSPARDGEEAGLSVYMNPEHRYEIAVGRSDGRRRVFLRQRVGPHLEAVTASEPVDESNRLVLQVRATATEYEFSFGAVPAGADGARALRPLGKALARYLSSEVAGGFTGRLPRPVRDGQRPGRGRAGSLRLVRLRGRPGSGASTHRRRPITAAIDSLLHGVCV